MNHLACRQTIITGSKIRDKKLFRIIVMASVLLCIGHLLLGSNLVVVAIAFIIIIIGAVPIATTGFLRVGALLVLFVAFRYVDFATIAKFLMLQPLDSNLHQPIEAFFAVLLGLTGYLIAFFATSIQPLGKPLLKPILKEGQLFVISIISAVIGGASWVGKIKAVNSVASGVDVAHSTTVYAFFTSFYLLAIIAATAQTLVATNSRKSMSYWCAVLLFTQLIFAIIANARMPIINGFLAYVVTVIAFKGRIRWRYVAVATIVVACILSFITPFMLYVRGFREDLSAWGRLVSTADTAASIVRNAEVFSDLRERMIQHQSFLDYYGRSANVLERASLVEHVDVMIDGLDRVRRHHIGFDSVEVGLNRILPRSLNPQKDVGWSIGDWLYSEIGIPTVMGGYTTVPLIAEGYASFGWLGAFIFPVLFATPIFVIFKKIGWSLESNIWAIYLLLRVHNSFVEGDSGAYLITLFRFLPQDILLILAINYTASFLIRSPFRKKHTSSNLAQPCNE